MLMLPEALLKEAMFSAPAQCFPGLQNSQVWSADSAPTSCKEKTLPCSLNTSFCEGQNSITVR